MVAKTLTFAMSAAHQAIRPAFEAAKFMLRTRTTLAPSASARTVTRSPHSPSRRGISAPRRCCSHRSETSSHERGLRRSKREPDRNAVAKSRAGPRRRSADFGSLASRPAREHGRRPVSTNSGKGSPVRAWEIKAVCTRSALRSPIAQAPAPGRYLGHAPRRPAGIGVDTAPTRGNAPPGPAPATPTPSGGPASWPRWLATPRAPPRPRGGENRAGERVPPFSRTYAQGGCRLNGKMAVNRVFGRGIPKSHLGGNVNGPQRP